MARPNPLDLTVFCGTACTAPRLPSDKCTVEIHLEARAGAGPNSDSAPPPRSACGPELTSHLVSL